MIKIHDCEQQTPEWFQLKLGKIGGSTFKNFINIDGKLKAKGVLVGHVAGLIAELETEMPNDVGGFESDAMAHGNEYEPKVIDKLKDKWFKPIGFATNAKYKYAGVSPDMVHFRDDDYFRGCEIKCPSSKVQIKRFLEDKIPNEYLPQIYMYFLIFDKMEIMTFASYDPFNERREMFKKDIHRQDLTDQLTNAHESLLAIDKLIEKHLVK